MLLNDLKNQINSMFYLCPCPCYSDMSTIESSIFMRVALFVQIKRSDSDLSDTFHVI